jgi:hypothetical protein
MSDTTPALPVTKPEPRVEKSPSFEPGQKVRHDNGTTYTIRHITAEGIALEGVANLVHPSALRPVKS